MSEYAKGLKLAVTDRDALKEFVLDNAHEPGLHTEFWGANSVPSSIYIVKYYRDDGDNPCYRAVDEHVNGVVKTTYWNRELLEDMVEEGILERDGYEVEFVEEHDA